MKKLLGLLFFISFSVQALEIDEKLTVRIVKTSETRKTIMINRGIEDGIAEGDHAKFVVTAGIVARGVCVKVSPTRSVWALYRLVNADFVVNDSVMSLKITAPVKITKDESQTLVQEDTPTKPAGEPATLGIPLAEGANDLGTGDKDLEDADLKALEKDQGSRSIGQRNKEIYGFLNYSGLTGSTKTDVGSATYTASQTYYHVGVGGEYYPRREREWYSRFSLLAQLSFMASSAQSYSGASIENSYIEGSLGANWHPLQLPSAVNRVIPYVHGAFNLGMVESKVRAGTESTTSTDLFSADGSTSGFGVGFGFKYYTARGFGARLLFDYYMRSEAYKEDVRNNIHNKVSTGPRIMLGLSYRL